MLKETMERNKTGKKTMFLKYIFVLFLGFLVGGATVLERCTVAGVAFVGALGCGASGIMGFIGVVMGYIFAHGFSQTIMYLGTAVFVYTITFLFQYTKIYRSKWFVPLVVFLLMILIRAYGSINVIRGDTERIWGDGIEALTGACLTYIFSFSLRNKDFMSTLESHNYSIYVLLATVISGLPSLYLFHKISVLSIISMGIIFVVLYRGNISVYPIAAVIGAALQYGNPERNGAFILFILYCGADLFPLKRNRLLLGAYFMLVTFLWEVYLDYSHEIIWHVCESFLASAIFSWILSKEHIQNVRSSLNDSERGWHDKNRNIMNLSKLLCLSMESDEQLPSIQQTPNMDHIFDCALEQVCGSCEKKLLCWNKQGGDSAALLNRTTKYIMERGRLEEADLSSHFRLSCIRCHSIVLAVNYELRRWYLSERLLESERMNAYIGKRQNRLFGQMLKALTLSEGSLKDGKNQSSQRFSVEIGMASKRKRGETVCGDSVKSFKTSADMLYIVLSDGIGCGEEAHEYSSYVVSLLENGLKLLDDPSDVIELTHLSLQSLNWWAAATIDLLSIDLNTGELMLYKLGASPSYIFTADEMKRFEGNSYSAGSCFDARVVLPSKFSLTSDAVIVLASDGVSLDENEAYLRTTVNESYPMKKLAKQLLLCAHEHDSDDQTVISVYIKNSPNAV